MANAAQLKTLSEAVIAAQAAQATAAASFAALEAAVEASVPTERAAFVAASEAFNDAIAVAQVNLDWQASYDALNAASEVTSIAISELAEAADHYDGE